MMHSDEACCAPIGVHRPANVAANQRGTELSEEQLQRRREVREHVQTELKRVIASSRTLYGHSFYSAEALWRVADHENKGSLSRKNWAAIVKRLDIFITPAHLNDLWESLGPDKDGFASFAACNTLMHTKKTVRKTVVGKRAMGGWWLKQQAGERRTSALPTFRDFVDSNGHTLEATPMLQVPVISEGIFTAE